MTITESIKTATHRCVCSLINVRIIRITSYTIEHACLLFLLACHESRCFCHDCEHLSQYQKWLPTVKVLTNLEQPNAWFRWIHGILRLLIRLIQCRRGWRPLLNHSNDPSRMILEAFVYTRLRYRELAAIKFSYTQSSYQLEVYANGTR